MAVRHPTLNQRILLIGEADIWRNTALGLTPAQVLEAFRIEFGVDRCEVLPAVSFHMDFELCVRIHDGRLVAFVNDTPAAVRIILDTGAVALEKHGVIDGPTATTARDALSKWEGAQFLSIIQPPLMKQAGSLGGFPFSLAESFSVGPGDSGVGNFQRFLLAMDILLSWTLPEGESPPDAHAAAYLRSFERRDQLREQFQAQLLKLGFMIVPVPSMSDADRGMNYLNGLHERTRYLMPAWGGLYAPLDEAARRVFESALGPGVEIMPVYCAETQRRAGGVHCSASALWR